MKKPVVLVVMDGVGESADPLGNMVMQATTPTLDELKANDPFRTIKAHGTAVGLPSDDDMGNSEVGHNALGCGQVYFPGRKAGQRIHRKRQDLYFRNLAEAGCGRKSLRRRTAFHRTAERRQRTQQYRPSAGNAERSKG